MRMKIAGRLGVLCALATGSLPLVAQEAQTAPGLGLGALGVMVGAAAVQYAGTGIEFGGRLDFGSIGTRRARLLFDLEFLRADIERSNSTGGQVGGSFRDVSGNVGVNFNLIEVGRITPYVGLGLGVHSLSTSTSNALAGDIYDGALVGVHAAGGVSFVLGQAGRIGGNVEVRRVGAKDINRTSFRAGLSLLFGELVHPRAVTEQ